MSRHHSLVALRTQYDLDEDCGHRDLTAEGLLAHLAALKAAAPVCVYCGRERVDHDATCPGCGAAEVRHRFTAEGSHP